MSILPPDQSVLQPGQEGITIYAGVSNTPPDTRKVRWVRQSDGAVVAQLVGLDLANTTVARVEALVPPGYESSIAGLNAVDSQLGVGAGLEAATHNWSPQPAHTTAYAGNFSAEILNSANGSGFLKHLVTRDQSLQTGSVTIAMGVGALTQAINLGTSWPTAHDFFLVTMHPQGSLNCSYIGASPSGLGTGIVQLTNNVAQNIDFAYLSLGR